MLATAIKMECFMTFDGNGNSDATKSFSSGVGTQ